MRFFSIIILFCFAVAGFALLAKFWLRGSVEAEMELRSLTLLNAAGFEGVSVDFDHLTGVLAGYVDSPEEKGTVVALLREKLPTAYWPDEDQTSLDIRPTLLPWLSVTRKSGSDEAKVVGVLSDDEEASRALLGSRLHALPEVGKVNNEIKLDPKVLPFPKMAEFASVASGLLVHSEVAEIDLHDDTLKIVGSVPNDGLKSGLLDLARQISSRNVVDEILIKVPDIYSPVSELKITRNRFGITLTGVLSSEADRSALLSIFQKITPYPGIVDRLEVNTSRSKAAWENHLPKIVPILLGGLVGEMTAEFTPTQIRLRGHTLNGETQKSMKAGLSPLSKLEPKIEIIADIGVKKTSGKKTGEVRLVAVYEGGLLVLTGVLPDETVPPRIEAKLSEILPKLSIKNEIKITPKTEGNEWVAQLPEFFAEALSRVKSATFTIGAGQLNMDGRTLSLSDRQILQNIAVNMVPANFTIQNLLVHADVPRPKEQLQPEVRAKLKSALEKLPIYFDKGSDTLNNEAKKKTESIAGMFKTIDAAYEIIVTGCSDNVGNEESNRQLSLRRATAVLEDLARLEVPKTTMTTASVVENVSNLSRSERWKSRRVEVSLKLDAERQSAAQPHP